MMNDEGDGWGECFGVVYNLDGFWEWVMAFSGYRTHLVSFPVTTGFEESRYPVV